MAAPEPLSQPAHRRRIWVATCVAILLATHAALAVHTLSVKTVTVDELAHLPAGITYWQKGSFALHHQNPPLVKLLLALPALALRPSIPYQAHGTRTHFEFGYDFMYANAARYQRIYFWARCMVVVFSLFAGWLVFRWGQAIFGTRSGLLALALWCLSPNLLAHAGIVTMDMGLTAAFVLASYTLWRYLREPGLLRAAACGAALGLALLAKFIAVLLLASWAIVLCSLYGARLHPRLRARIPAMPPGPSTAAHGLVLLATVLAIVNAGYGFEGTGGRLDSFHFQSAELSRVAGTVQGPASSVRRNRFEGTWLGALPVPLPEHFLLGFDETRRHTEGRYFAYLSGEWRREGWQKYYLMTLLLKVPLGTWLLSLLALAAALAEPRFRGDPVSELAILVPPVVFFLAISLLTDINLGLRYVLPVLPLWFLWISRLGRAGSPGRLHRWRWLVAGAVLWNLLCVVRIHPHHLSYFNELAGGPEAGHRHLLDSNLDWGQDLHALSTWLERRRPGEPVGLAYFGSVDPGILRDQGRGFPFRLAPIGDPGALQLMAVAPGGRLASFLGETWREMREGRRPLPHALARLPRARLPERPPGTVLLGDPVLRSEMQEQLGYAVGPQPGLFAVSANFVHGYPYRLRDHDGNLWFAAATAFNYFAELEPVAKAGYSIFIYDLTLEDANSLRETLDLEPLPR